jgi:formyl-CoA transferase
LISIQNEREWVNLCAKVLGNAALASDARFVSNRLRVANRPAVEAIIRDKFAAMTRESLIAALDQADIAFGAVNTVADLAQHPHLRRATFATPGGPVSIPLPPSLPPGFEPGAVPAIGAHSESVRREFS